MSLKQASINEYSNKLSSPFGGQGAALVTNNAAVTPGGVPTRLALQQQGYPLVKLFSPEHGLDAAGEDGSFQQHGTDALTGLPITSLYGERLAPTRQDLENINLVIFDIPDVGCRFYTYLWTMTYVMESCAACNVPMLVLDRPNPIGGNIGMAEGPMLSEQSCASFIGRWRIPVRHSCTLGELARYFAATKIKGLHLEVTPAAGWKRNNATSADFTPTSPAIQKREAALLYPGLGLLEGINVNEGRGTAMPFEICGAPWINQWQLHETFMQHQHPGIDSTPISYVPNGGLYAGETCYGLQFSIADESVFHPVQTGISLLRGLLRLYPNQARERLYPTVANPTGEGHLDKLLGIPAAISTLKGDKPIDTTVASEWMDMIGNYLLYA